MPTGTRIEIRYETLTKTWAAFSPIGNALMVFTGLVGRVNRSLGDFTKWQALTAYIGGDVIVQYLRMTLSTSFIASLKSAPLPTWQQVPKPELQLWGPPRGQALWHTSAAALGACCLSEARFRGLGREADTHRWCGHRSINVDECACSGPGRCRLAQARRAAEADCCNRGVWCIIASIGVSETSVRVCVLGRGSQR